MATVSTSTYLPVTSRFSAVVVPATEVVIDSHFGDREDVALATLPVVHAPQVRRSFA